MTIGIIGLGLIGGSFAKAYHKAGWRVLAKDVDRSMLDFAILSGAVNKELEDSDLDSCDLILICTYPAAAEEYLIENAAKISKHTTVIDCLGTKRRICSLGFRLSKEHGFLYAGGHPMAGTHNSGFKYSREDLFDGAPMVLCPPNFYDIRLLDEAKKMLAPVGFGRVSITNAADHDKRIAFTSQLAHVVSNAYVKSPSAREHAGFSAGSYRDLTRVAWLNPDMWAELFLENKENMLFELDTIIENLTAYKTAIQEENFPALRQLLEDGRRIKEEVDGH